MLVSASSLCLSDEYSISAEWLLNFQAHWLELYICLYWQL